MNVDTSKIVRRLPLPLQVFMAQMHADAHKHRVAKAKVDPAAHKKTLDFDEGARLSYRYWRGGKDGLGRELRFCYSIERNAAGYYLGWREVIGKKQIKRDMWIARKTRKRCSEICKRRAETAKAARSTGATP